MHISSTIIAFAATIGLATAAGAATLPNGGYMVTSDPNGTTIYESLTDSSLAPLVIDESTSLKRSEPTLLERSAKFARSILAKRRIDCWGYQLDAAGVDQAAIYLANACGNGRAVTTEPDRTVRIVGLHNGMMVYYCVNAGGKTGNCDRGDVSYGLGRMDSQCGRYEASWFGWPGSFEILGKAREGDNVCAGNMNGVPF
ncbi:hypothetical protein BS50DRAFT_589940 [Corynespora cassiicola Philippines]|uniref:Ecp2 effector protein domain-containing protein n=1 Tax=Corynespora cassiicola Philippines TaxID=1448308 RepID=A0A2T2NJD0_CORCC|nr:hypothetical protein BS50DRAFT_589940 [Corynespora cassiicola Philippines]